MAYPRVVLAIVAALAAAGVNAQMVKCVDANGVTHYTDRPPPGCKGKQVEIHGQPYLSGGRPASKDAPGNGATGKASPANPHDDVVRAEREFRIRQMDREKSEQREAKARALREQRCARLKSQYQMFGAGGRIARINEKGERIYLEDSERESRLAQIRSQMIRNGCTS